jgi:hypothetical protein
MARRAPTVRLRAWRWLALPLVFAALVSTPARAAVKAAVVLADDPGGVALPAEVAVQIPAGGGPAIRTYFLRFVGPKPVPTTLLADANDDVSVTFSDGAAAATSTYTADLAKGEAVVRIAVTATKPGTVRILARFGSAIVTVTTLKATPAPVVTIAGADTMGVAVTSRETPFRVVLDLFAGDAPVTGLVAAVNPLRGDNGETVRASCVAVLLGTAPPAPGNCPAVTPKALDARGTGQLVVDADLPVSGTWRSAIRLTYGDTAAPAVALVVTRTLAQSSVLIDSVALARIDADPEFLWVHGKARVSRTVSVRDTTGRTVKLAAPRIVIASKTGATAEEIEAQIIKVEDVTEKPATDASKGLVLQGNETRQLRVVVGLPNKPAEYTFKLRFDEAGAQPTNIEYTVTVRRPWYIALAWIALGLILSLVARLWWIANRTRWTAQLPVAQLQGEIDRLRVRLAPLAAPEAAVIDGVDIALGVVYEEASSGDRDKATKELAVLGSRSTAASEWILTRRRVITGPERLRVSFTQSLDDLVDDITAEPDIDAAAATTLLATVRAVATRYDDALKTLVKGDITALRNRLMTLGTETASAMAQRLDDALVLADDRPLDASAKLTELRGEAARLLALRLEAELNTGPDPSWGITPEEWDTDVDSVRSILAQVANERDGEVALNRYQQADAMMLTIVAKAIQRRIRARLEKLRRIENPGQSVIDEINKHDVALSNVGKAIGEIATDPVAARAALDEAATDFTNNLPAGDVLDATGTENGLAAPAGTSLDAPDRQLPPTPKSPKIRIPRVRELRRRLTIVEIIATIAAALFALPLGLAFLYDTAYTWGSLANIVAAVAWGLGLQQISGQAFTGVDGLRKQLLGETVTA